MSQFTDYYVLLPICRGALKLRKNIQPSTPLHYQQLPFTVLHETLFKFYL